MARTDKSTPTNRSYRCKHVLTLPFCHHMNPYAIGPEINPALIGRVQHRRRRTFRRPPSAELAGPPVRHNSKVMPNPTLSRPPYIQTGGSHWPGPPFHGPYVDCRPWSVSRWPPDASGAGMRTCADLEGTSCAGYGADRPQTRQSIQDIHY